MIVKTRQEQNRIETLTQWKGPKNKGKEQSVEQGIGASANNLCKNIDASKYKHIVVEFVLLKYISDYV